MLRVGLITTDRVASEAEKGGGPVVAWIGVESIHLSRADGTRPQIIGDGDYLVF
jgi:hypothetical protein